ncbi:hypothetical protein D1872_257040 [compost metagenome]
MISIERMRLERQLTGRVINHKGASGDEEIEAYQNRGGLVPRRHGGGICRILAVPRLDCRQIAGGVVRGRFGGRTCGLVRRHGIVPPSARHSDSAYGLAAEESGENDGRACVCRGEQPAQQGEHHGENRRIQSSGDGDGYPYAGTAYRRSQADDGYALQTHSGRAATGANCSHRGGRDQNASRGVRSWTDSGTGDIAGERKRV